jgi:threonine dehydrogenase-like Zn-dependent dehydrogenase
LGADVAFDPMADDVPQAIRENTEGRGADVIVEASGSPEALNEAIKVVAFQGTVVVVSWYGIKPVALSLGEEFHRNRIRIKSSQVSYIDPALTPRWSAKRRMSLALKLLPQLNLEGLISHIYPFEEAPKAYEKIDKNPEEVLQVILKYV